MVNEKRRSAVNPRYATQLPSNAVAIFNKAVKKICSVKTRSVASPSKVPSSGVSARLPPSTSPERPMVNRAALKPVVTASKNIKFSDRAFHDASVAKKMQESAIRDAAASAKNGSDLNDLEDLADVQPFLTGFNMSPSLAFILESAASSALTAAPAAPVTHALAIAAPLAQTAAPSAAVPATDAAPSTPTADPSAAVPATDAAQKAKMPKKTPVVRQVSKTGKTHVVLSAEVRAINKNLPSHLQLKNVKQANVAVIDDFLQRQEDIVAAATIHAQCEGAKTRLTQQIQVTVCVRMLTLLAKTPDLLTLFQDSCAGSDRQQNDAGANPVVNTGLGMGLNHAYHPAMEVAFNDLTFVDEFPFEYFAPTDHELLAIHSDGVNRVPVPSKIINGLFAGMGITECLVPEGFPPSFFNLERLSTIFTAGLTEYHNALAKFSSSGQHGKPLWFFVAPRKTIVAEDQHLYLDLAAKRWDTLAFHLMFEKVQELSKIFAKVIPNGKGGAENAEAQAPVVQVGASARVVATRERENAEKRAVAADARSQEGLKMKRERHEQHMASFGSKNNQLETLDAIKSYCEMKKTFAALPDQQDMVTFCDAKIASLKESLTSCSATTSSTTANTSLFSTPGPHTPTGVFTPPTQVLSPIAVISFSPK